MKIQYLYCTVDIVNLSYLIDNLISKGASTNHLDSSGVSIQMNTLLHKPYQVKYTRRGSGSCQNTHKSDHVVYGWPLIPFDHHHHLISIFVMITKITNLPLALCNILCSVLYNKSYQSKNI